MDIYITDLGTNDRLRFPMLPEKISIREGAAFQSYNIMSVGEVKFPYGENLTGFSWSGMLPGKSRANAPFVKEWIDPKEFQGLISMYKQSKKKLRLLITEMPVNHNVYLESFDHDYQNGYGDINYQISFVLAKDLIIYTEGNVMRQPSSRPAPSEPKTYTVKPGDTLWGISQKFTGQGAAYPSLHSANQPPLGSNPDKIYPGQVITLP